MNLELFWSAILHGTGLAIRALGDAVVAYPWLFLGVSVLVLVRLLVPRGRRR
jgi:hypothetical protein